LAAKHLPTVEARARTQTLKSILFPRGFEIVQESGAGLGALVLFEKGNLKVRIFYDYRDNICVFSADSGTVRRWKDQHAQERTNRYDLYLYLSEPDIMARFPEELEKWLEEKDQ
jgi:hypothetical protein